MSLPNLVRGGFGYDRQSFFGNGFHQLVYDSAIDSVSLPSDESGRTNLAGRAYGYVRKRLKEEENGQGISRFEMMILEEMSNMTGKSKRKLVEDTLKIRALESNPALVVDEDFPKLHAQAQKKVVDGLKKRMEEPEMQVQFLINKALGRERKRIERDYSLALPELGEEGALDYSSCLFELRYISTGPVVNEKQFKQSILKSIRDGVVVDLIHIKSLRYTYPADGGLLMLSDTKGHESMGINNERRFYPSEEVIFDRLAAIRSLLDFYGIDSRLSVVAADKDLEYLFPDGNPLADEDTLREARRSAHVYVRNLQTQHPDIERIDTLTGYLDETGSTEAYQAICERALEEARRGGGELVPDKILEMRVNHQFEHYREMFGEKYDRGMARFTASHQIANLLALSSFFETFDEPPIVVIDGRGFETNLIGDYNPDSRSIFLTRLKDQVEVLQ